MPNKKGTRVRNRPRNKANRLKILENQDDGKDEKQPPADLSEPNGSDVDDIDLPDLMEDPIDVKNAKQEQDPTVALENLMKSKFLQKDSSKDKNCEVASNPDIAKVKSANSKVTKSKDGERATNASEKNAFIQNLQKKMEAMMANGKRIL